MIALTLAGVSLRRIARDRRALFFLVVLPVLVIVLVGATVQGLTNYRVAVVGAGEGAAGKELLATLQARPELTVHRYVTESAAATALRRSELDAVVVVPGDLDARLAAGDAIGIPVLAEPANGTQQAALTAISAALSGYSARLQAARLAVSWTGGGLAARQDLAASLQDRIPRVTATVRSVDSSVETLPEGFSYSAPTMLVLFVFLDALASAATIIATRRLGLYQRILAGPVAARSVVLGEILAASGVALGQSAVIVAVGAAVFGVSWGDPIAATALVVVWALVAAAAGVLAGTVFATPEQAGAIGPALGIALGMLGGCMWPLSIVTPVMRTVGHVVPQAWAVDAWTTLLSQRGTLTTIGTDLLVLVGFALVVGGLAVVRLAARVR